MNAIVPISYAGPVEYFVVLAKYQNVIVENKEHFVKQSFRNRCNVIGAQGVIPLIIPTNRKSRERTIIDEVGIANDFPWQALHWKTLCTAYRSSPFFEYYEPYFEKFYLNSFENLFDFNFQLLQLIASKVGLNVNFQLSNEYKKEYSIPDFRTIHHPKTPLKMELDRYIQVFEDKLGFVPNLSVLDLLFNLGPSAKDYLLKHAEQWNSEVEV